MLLSDDIIIRDLNQVVVVHFPTLLPNAGSHILCQYLLCFLLQYLPCKELPFVEESR